MMFAQEASSTVDLSLILAGFAAALVTIFTGVVGPVMYSLRKQLKEKDEKHEKDILRYEAIINQQKIDDETYVKDLKNAHRVALRSIKAHYDNQLKEMKKEYEERIEIDAVKTDVRMEKLYAELEACEKEREASNLRWARYEDRLKRMERGSAAKVRAKMDPNGILTIVSCNVATSKLFGYTRSHLMGKAVEILIAPSHREKHLEKVAKHGDIVTDPHFTNVLNDGMALHKDGTTFPVTVELSKVTIDGQMLWQAVITPD